MAEDLQNPGSVDLQAPGSQPSAPGALQRQQLSDAGYGGQELADWESGERGKLKTAGFSDDEVDKHFGTVKPDMSTIRTHVQNNLSTYNPKEPTVGQEVAEAQSGQMPPIADKSAAGSELPQFEGPTPLSAEEDHPKEAKDLFDAIKSGLEISVPGLLVRNQKPDVITPADAPSYMRIASQMSTLAGDLPIMLGGGILGGILGAPAGPAGATVGAGSGAFALPAAMRDTLMLHYQKGDIQNFQDFWERTSAIFLDTLKQGVIGGATAGVGGLVGKVAAPVLSAGVMTAAKAASEIATMVTVGKALEGQAPKLQDFTDAAIAVAFMHGAIEGPKSFKSIAEKMQNIYAKTALTPDKVVEQAGKDLATRQELLSDSTELPKAFQPFIDEAAVPKKVNPETVLQDDRLSDPEVLTDAKKLSAVVGDQERASVLEDHLKEMAKESDDPTTQRMAQEGLETLQSIKADLPETSEDTIPSIHDQEETTLETELPSKLTETNPVLNDSEEPVSFQRRAEEEDAFGLNERGAVGSEPPKPKTPLEEAEQKILDRIAPRGKKKGEPLTWNKFKEERLDALDPMARLVKDLTGGDKIPASYDPYKLMRLLPGVKGKLNYFMEHGTVEYSNFEKNGESLKDILSPVWKEKKELNAYLASSRVLTDLERRGIEHGFDVDAAKLVKEAGDAKYGPIAERLTDYQNRVLKYLYDSGRISAESLDRVTEENKSYVPFFRIDDETGELVGGGKKGDLSNPLQAIKGSSSKIAEPIESIVLNTAGYLKMAEKNRATEALVTLAQASGVGDQFVEFKGQGVELHENEIGLFKDGKMERYEVAPDVARAWQGMDGNKKQLSLAMRVMFKAPATLLRSTLTLTPDFMARHGIRYDLSSTLLGEKMGVPAWDSLRALGDIFGKDPVTGKRTGNEVYQQWLLSGSTAESFKELNDRYIENNVWKLNRETGFIDAMQNLIRHPLDSVRLGAEILDSAVRVAHFKRVAGENPSFDNIVEGGFESRNNPVDIQRAGSQMSAYNQITSFANVHIQGLLRTAEAFIERPATMAFRMASAITLPSLALWWWNKDDPDYQDLPRWQKDLSWIFMVHGSLPFYPPLVTTKLSDNKYIFRVPKPWEAGVIFGSLPERVMEGLYQKQPRAFDKFGDTLMKAFAPSVLPTMTVPLIEHFANRSTLTDRSLISAPMEKLLPQLQYTEYTTESAKMIGRALQAIPIIGPILTNQNHSLASPIIVQNYIRAWSGNLGMYALQMADKGLIASGAVPDPKHADTPLAQLPVIKAFMIQYPSAQSEGIQNIYDEYDKHEKMLDSFNEAVKTNNQPVIKQLQADPEFSEKMVSLAAAKNALGRQTQVIKLIDQNPDIPTAQKRQQIDQIYSGMIEMARGIMKGFDKKESKDVN